jgi:hypothetical protein
MLTQEIIKQQSALASLTDEQVNAIVTLSQNDESAVIGQRIGELYRQLDATIARETGIERNGDEKTYLYLERAAKALAERAKDADGLTKQVETLTKEKSKLEKAIAEGTGGEEAKKALAQAQKDLAAVTKQFTELKADYDNVKAQHEKELFGIKVENEINAATAGLKFKSDFPASVTSVILSQAIQKVKGMNPEFIDDGKGGKTLAFKDETGAVKRNPENQLNPYTAGELLTKELKEMGVLDEGRKVTGTGTKPPTGAMGSTSVDVSGARTRSEANEIITQQLMQQGLVNGSEAFQAALNQAWKDNNIAALPMQ